MRVRCVAENQSCFRGTTALQFDEPEAIHGFGLLRPDPKCLGISLFGGANLSGSQLYGTEFEQTINRVAVPQVECGKLGLRLL